MAFCCNVDKEKPVVKETQKEVQPSAIADMTEAKTENAKGIASSSPTESVKNEQVDLPKESVPADLHIEKVIEPVKEKLEEIVQSTVDNTEETSKIDLDNSSFKNALLNEIWSISSEFSDNTHQFLLKSNSPNAPKEFIEPTYPLHAIIVSGIEQKSDLLTRGKNLGYDVNGQLQLNDSDNVSQFTKSISVRNAIGTKRFFATGSPLHFAAYSGNLEVCQLLLKWGATSDGVAFTSSSSNSFSTSGSWSVVDCANASGNWEVQELFE
ncbi:hypothetical protein BC833DRAFT_654093 [Globomyces pollinis-pini]|nr:hypothetical protein BC833DRAFT_654093 [Globomyces pollinis-pini]